MEFRYRGFEQPRNVRSYRFDKVATGEISRRFVVTVDLELLSRHHIGVQEGPALCLRKLKDGASEEPRQELTNDDLLAYVAARTLAEERRANSRRGLRRGAARAASTW